MRRYLALILLAALGLAGCASPMGSKEDPTDTPLVVDVGADIASGCWNASQRTLPLAETEEGVSIQQWSEAPAMRIDPAKTYTATVVTSMGTFTIDLFADEAPIATNNFVCLARAGFYDNVVFHRIIQGFVIQSGDPTGTGTGGPGYLLSDDAVAREYARGTVAMANTSRPNTSGSQFFVCLDDVSLPKTYTIFGEVTSGMETVDAIGAVPTEPGADGQMSSPLEPVTMESVAITEA